jgi:hypothetical protein
MACASAAALETVGLVVDEPPVWVAVPGSPVGLVDAAPAGSEPPPAGAGRVVAAGAIVGAGPVVVPVAGSVRSSPGGPMVEVVDVPWMSPDSVGICTGFTNTMMHAMTTRHAPAAPSSLRLRSMAPMRAARKKPLRRKNRTMLTEFLTASA